VNVTINGESTFDQCTFSGNVTINGNSTFDSCQFGGGSVIDVKIDGNADVTLTGTTNIHDTLTIEEGSTLTNSGTLSCGSAVIQINYLSTNPVSIPAPIPAAISVYGKLTNDNKHSIIYAYPNIGFDPGASNPFLAGNGIELKKGGSKGGSCTNSGHIYNGITYGSPNGPNPINLMFPNGFPTFLTLETNSSLSNNDTGIINGDFDLETGSSLTNNGTINGNINQETGSTFINNGTINEPSNNQS